jgi:hypothetical protein
MERHELESVYWDNVRNHNISQDGQDGISQEVAADLGLPTIEGTQALVAEVRADQTPPVDNAPKSASPSRQQRPLGRLRLRGESEGEDSDSIYHPYERPGEEHERLAPAGLKRALEALERNRTSKPGL